MAEKKTEDKDKFETEVYKLGLELIAAYRTGNCADKNKTLELIIEIFKRGKTAFFIGGKSDEI